MKFTRARSRTTCIDRCIPAINHAPFPFTENKRYPAKPSEFGDVVNRNRDSVYQTEAVLALSCFAHKGAAPAHPRDENSKSTSMKRMYLALLASASFLSFGFPQAAANEASFVIAPLVIYPDPTDPPVPPVRMASADRPN